MNVKSLLKNQWVLLVLMSVLAVAVLVVLGILNEGARPALQGNHLDLYPSLQQGVTADGLPYLGDPNAPVTMRVFEDLGCPNCKTFFQDTETLVIEEYVATGKVRIVIISMAFVNNQSFAGAEAVSCAADQGKFWEYRDVLFETQGQKPFTRETLVEIAEGLGLDRSAFTNCYDLGKHDTAIRTRTERNLGFGISGTPTIDINGERLVGAYPFETTGTAVGVKDLIERALGN